eukprot:11994385-Prorocentrum_lima.AAC.1
MNQTSSGNTVFHRVASRGRSHFLESLEGVFKEHASKAINLLNYSTGGRQVTSFCSISLAFNIWERPKC